MAGQKTSGATNTAMACRIVVGAIAVALLLASCSGIPASRSSRSSPAASAASRSAFPWCSGNPDGAKLPAQAVPPSDDYVEKVGTHLVDSGHTWRFGGANIYWLGLDQNVGGIGYPTRFRIDDVLETAKDMGV